MHVIRVTQRAYTLLPYIPSLFPYFSPCGTNRSLKVFKPRGISRRVGSTRGNRHASMSWTLIHLIMINASGDFVIVDRINEIRQPQFNCALGEPRINMWLHKDNPMKIRQWKSRGVQSALWDRGPLISCNHNHPKSHQ